VTSAKTSPAQIDPALAEHAEAIRYLGKRVIKDVIEIGRHLTEAKVIAGHGNWLPWLEREFGWTEMTATRFINVYEMSKSNKLLDFDLPVSGLYLLAAPSTPEEARDEIIERAKAGEPVSTGTIKETIARTRTDTKSKQPQAARRERRSKVMVGGEHFENYRTMFFIRADEAMLMAEYPDDWPLLEKWKLEFVEQARRVATKWSALAAKIEQRPGDRLADVTDLKKHGKPRQGTARPPPATNAHSDGEGGAP
jgi:hypothetical protein